MTASASPPEPGVAGHREAPARPALLVVDDEAAIGELIEIWFQTAGWLVDKAGTGPEGLALASASPPDIVLLDLMLPGCGGMEVLRRLRESDPRAVVVLTSGWDGPEQRSAALAAGAADYIVKPFSLRALELRLQELLAQHQRPRR